MGSGQTDHGATESSSEYKYSSVLPPGLLYFPAFDTSVGGIRSI